MKKIINHFLKRSNNKDISYEQLKNMQKQNIKLVVIDVRSKQEYSEGHIKGAINIPLDKIKEISGILKTECIIVYCKSGLRSKKAQKKLEKMGFNNVLNLAEGIKYIRL